MPRVSIVTPCYNAGAFIAPMMRSVAAQTLADWEQIVVDDGSTDDSAARAELEAAGEPRVRVLRQPNGGVARARNAGFAASSPESDFVLFLDADDELEPTMLETLVGHLDAHAEVGLVFCRPVMIGLDGAPLSRQAWLDRWGPAPRRAVKARRLRPDELETPWESVYALAGILPSLALVRRSVYADTPGWDEEFGQPCEDTDVFLQVALRSRVHYLDTPLLRRRIHPEQSVSDEAHLYRQRARLYAKWRALASAPGGPVAAVRSGDRFLLQMNLALGLDEAASSLRAGRVTRAARFAGGAVRRYALPLMLGRPR